MISSRQLLVRDTLVLLAFTGWALALPSDVTVIDGGPPGVCAATEATGARPAIGMR